MKQINASYVTSTAFYAHSYLDYKRIRIIELLSDIKYVRHLKPSIEYYLQTYI